MAPILDIGSESRLPRVVYFKSGDVRFECGNFSLQYLPEECKDKTLNDFFPLYGKCINIPVHICSWKHIKQFLDWSHISVNQSMR